jgi:hypothetical protein
LVSVSKNQTGMGFDFWNWELEAGLKLDQFLDPEPEFLAQKTSPEPGVNQ